MIKKPWLIISELINFFQALWVLFLWHLIHKDMLCQEHMWKIQATPDSFLGYGLSDPDV